MKTHWHDHNPWADRVVYVPIERLAECVAGGKVSDGVSVKDYDVAFILNTWMAFGDKLDAYILPQPNGIHLLGVRYNAIGNGYLSPYNENHEITEKLLMKYRKEKK